MLSDSYLQVKDLIDELVCGVAIQEIEEAHSHNPRGPPYSNDEP